jgi:type I restriction enzyme M protein
MFYANGVKVNALFFDRKPASPSPWTQTLWVYDLRTNHHFNLKANPLKRSDLDEFVACYHADNRHDRKETWSESNPAGRWRAYPYESRLQRDKVSLEIS